MRGRGSRGQSVVEIAIALPFLVLLFSGLVDLGRAYYGLVTVTDAARDGARMLVTSSSSGVGPGSAAGCTAVRTAVVNLTSSPTCPTTATSPAAGQVLVAISCPDAGACLGRRRAVGGPLTAGAAGGVGVYFAQTGAGATAARVGLTE